MRKLLFQIHLWVALSAAAFVVILGLTGAVMAFETELDRVLHWRTAYVKPEGKRMSLGQLGEIVSRLYPGERIGGYSFSDEPQFSYQVALPGRQIYVNPHTGSILGVKPGGIDFLGRVHQLHLRLLIRTPADPGKDIMSWAGVAILFLSLSGVYLWWPYWQVTVRRPFWSRRFWLDLHNAVGICSFAFLAVLALTGIMIGFEEKTVPLFYRMTGSTPRRPPQTFPTPPAGAHPIGVDAAVAIARAAIPGTAPFQINVPPAKGAYMVRSRFPEDLTGGGRSMVVIDPYTGAVLFAQGSRTAPAGTRMVNWNRAIHTGDIFGVPSKFVMSLMSLALVGQAVSGIAMWLKKKGKR